MRLIFFICLILYSEFSLSQEIDTISSNNDKVIYFKNLSEVVVTGQLRETTIDKSLYNIRVIDQKKISSGLYGDLGTLLEKSLNINLSQDNVLGSSVSIMGISGRNVKILIDGIPVIGRLNGNIDLSQINLLNVDRVELVEGPMSTIYGSDALAGTINIITKKTFNHNLSLNTFYESIGKYNFDIHLSKNIKYNQFAYQFARKYFDGWSEGQEFSLLPVSLNADSNRVKQWKPKEQYINKLTHSFKRNKFFIHSYLELYNEKLTNLGSPVPPYFENAFDEFYKTKRYNIGLNAKYTKYNDEIRLFSSYSNYNRYKELIYKDLTNLTYEEIESSDNKTVFDAITTKIIYSNYIWSKLNFQFGLDFEFTTAEGQRILNNYKEQNDIASFLTIEYKLNDIISIRQSSRIIRNSNYNAPFIHSANSLLDFENYQIRIGYGKGFRAPDFKELFLNFVDVNHNIIGNEDLVAEKSMNYNFSNTFKVKINQTNIITKINSFYNIIENKINLYEDPSSIGRYSYFNIDKFKSKGININTKLSINKFEVSFGFSYMGTLSKTTDNSDLSKIWFFNTNYNSNSFIEINKNIYVNIFYKYIGKSPYYTIDNEIVNQQLSDSYNLLDLALTKYFYNKKFNFTIGLKNIFDVKNIKRNQSSNSVHNAGNNYISVGYGRSVFTKFTFKL